MPEDDFKSWVLDYARLRRWRIHHTRNDRKNLEGHLGFLDLTMARAGRVVFAELKGTGGTLSQGQLDWLTALGGIGNGRPASTAAGTFEAYAWWPSDRPLIERVLA